MFAALSYLEEGQECIDPSSAYYPLFHIKDSVEQARYFGLEVMVVCIYFFLLTTHSDFPNPPDSVCDTPKELWARVQVFPVLNHREGEYSAS